MFAAGAMATTIHAVAAMELRSPGNDRTSAASVVATIRLALTVLVSLMEASATTSVECVTGWTHVLAAMAFLGVGSSGTGAAFALATTTPVGAVTESPTAARSKIAVGIAYNCSLRGTQNGIHA